jgi:transposase
MIPFPANTHIWIVAGVTDMRRGFTGLSEMVQTALQLNSLSGQARWVHVQTAETLHLEITEVVLC